MTTRWKNGLGRVLPYLLYVLLFIASFYPQSFRPWDTVAYIGDSLEAVWILAWDVHQFFHAPTELFEANIFHPNTATLTYTDHRLLTAVAVAPVIWATGNPVLAYNVALALGCLLAAVAGRRLARVLGIGPLGAWTAGALYAFHTYQVNEGSRLHILYHGFLPLALEQFIRFLQTGKPRHAFYVGGWMILQGLVSSYHVLYGALLLTLLFLAAFVARPRPTLRRIPTLAAAALVSGLVFSPFVVPYLKSAHEQGFRHPLPEGIDLDHYFATTPTNLVYGAIGTEVRLQQQAPHFVGFVTLGLVALTLGLWLSGRKDLPGPSLLPSRVWVPGALALALVFLLLSLGKDMFVFGTPLGPGPYRLLYDWVPGFQLVRIPERLSLLVMLFVALLAGRALSFLFDEAAWGRPGRAAGVLLAIAVPLEHLSPLPHTDRIPVGEEVPAVYRWLRDQPVNALAEVPIPGEHLIRKESLHMYFSSYHLKPIIHGYESFPPLVTGVLRKLAFEFPSEASLQGFQRVGVDTIVVHHGWTNAEPIVARLPELVRAGRLEPWARFSGPEAHVYEGTMDEVYRLVPTEPFPAAPFPEGRRRLDPSWRYRTKAGDPLPAADGDPSTSWVVSRPLNGDEFYEITFEEPLAIRGLVIRLGRLSHFPNTFKVAGRDENGQWISLAWFDAAHKLQLLDGLMTEPRRSAIGFDLGGRELTGMRIMLEEGARSHAGWSIPEIEVWVP